MQNHLCRRISPEIFEAKIESQKYEIQSLQRVVQTTQVSLSGWDEVNLNSIQDVYVDDSVGTSISSASRVADSSISQIPGAGDDSELVHLRERSMPKAAPKFVAAPSTTPASKCSKQLLWPIELTAPTVSPRSWRTQKKKPNNVFLTNRLNRQKFEVGKSASRAKSLNLRSIPETQCHALVMLRMVKRIDDLITSASKHENQYRTSSGLGEILTGNFKKQVTTAEGKAQLLG